MEQIKRHVRGSTKTDGYNEFLKAAGFKSRNEHHKNALHLMIHQDKGKIFLASTINGGTTGKTRGFADIKDEPLTIAADASNSELGDALKVGWSKCVCNQNQR